MTKSPRSSTGLPTSAVLLSSPSAAFGWLNPELKGNEPCADTKFTSQNSGKPPTLLAGRSPWRSNAQRTKSSAHQTEVRSKRSSSTSKGEQRALPVGITVFDTIVDVTNEPDSDNWGTHRVELFASTVEVHGERKPCVRVRKPKGELALQKPTPATAKRAVRDDMDDEIPF